MPVEALSIEGATAHCLARAQQVMCEPLLDLVRTLADGTPPARFWIVTRGAIDGIFKDGIASIKEKIGPKPDAGKADDKAGKPDKD